MQVNLRMPCVQPATLRKSPSKTNSLPQAHRAHTFCGGWQAPRRVRLARLGEGEESTLANFPAPGRASKFFER